MLSLLIDNGADPNIPDVNGVSPLTCLITSDCSVEEVQFLVSKGASHDAIDNDGNSVLVYAIEHGDRHIVAFLRNQQASEAGVVGHELIRCAGRGKLEGVESALERGANPNHLFNATALLVAAESGHFEVVARLLASGACPDLRRSDEEFTPLIAAAYGGHLDVVQLLLQHGANPQCQVESMGTAIDYVRLGQLEGLRPNAPWKEIMLCVKG